ncbi:arylamine N-acetyltransferase, pineal gland isozyme NAT-3-like [Pseudophryne corroboree]|uniref:arylamine N-acetyltransferase, pineal gland isozyme NAT-3-like n=1 Tax=Pseudophryne corroboree TaxID=495146 RepID=UPI003081C35D
MDLNLYLQRIGIRELKPDFSTPSLSALREIHRRHLFSVPFESLSMHIGEKIILDTLWIYQKIVLRKRGGFCFENNGLFLWVLQELGYQPLVLSARVRSPATGVYGPPFDHMILSVELEGRRWLCDVGFGEGILDPFPLEAAWEQEQDSGVFRLRVEAEEWYLESKEDNDQWSSLYKFTLEERRFEDFREMCDYYQTSTSCSFFCKSFCSLQLPDGRLTYIGRKLVSTEYIKGGGSVKTTKELSEEEIPDLLREKFGIVLSAAFVPKDEILAPNPDGQ